MTVLAHLVAPLNAALFTLGNDHVTVAELLGFVTGAASVRIMTEPIVIRQGHGLVVGKFYPPHLGHQHLITQAAASCAELTVLVMAARSETLPLADRVRWLRAACAGQPGVTVTGTVCDAPVDFDDPVYLGACARGLQPWATTRLPARDVYLLTSHEGVPWHDDGLREGDLAIRATMTTWFAAALTAAGHSWVLLTGSLEDRLALAARVTDYVLDNRSRFGPAITDGARARVEPR
jgi:cytidyltransferase-like protein